jgi:hypothetical protein
MEVREPPLDLLPANVSGSSTRKQMTAQRAPPIAAQSSTSGGMSCGLTSLIARPA